jgi:outer membrane protein OmpA-like peptidoglycan-associated protein
MDNPYGKPATSVKRFSLMKWAVAAATLVLLALIWLGGPDPVDDTAGEGAGVGVEGTGPAGSVAAGAGAATLTLELAADGGLAVGGVVADETVRNQWLNEIRIGAQGSPVTDRTQIGSVAPAAADWTDQLSGLVAVMRERQLGSLRVEADRVVLQGAAADPAAKAETESMIRAQLPDGYRLESKLAVGPPDGGTTQAAASSRSKGAPPAGGATADSSAVASAPAVPPAAAPSAAAPASGGGSAQQEGGASSAAVERNDARALARKDEAGDARAVASKKPVRKPANCPRQLRPLAQPVYFKTDAATIPTEDRARLQRLGECLGRARVRVVGHADPRHTDEYNQELSERRARAVADALAAAGADPARVAVVGAGKAKAHSKKPTRQALQRARRVDIQLR